MDADASEAIGQVVKPSPLKKPRAHVVLNVAGLSKESLAQIFGSKQSREIQLQAQEPASAVVESLASVMESNPEVAAIMLDQQGLQGCTGNCVEEHMHATAGCMHATHEGSALTFSSGASLNLDQLADKLFAIEAASLYSGLQAQMQHNANQDVHILESTLVGLSGLEAAHGADSEQVAAARQGMQSLLKWAVEQLDAKYEGDVTYQVAGIPQAPSRSTVQEIMGWKQHARRRLAGEGPKAVVSQQANATAKGKSVYPPADEAAATKLFTAKACGYGGFLMILYFTLAGIWCMCNMPMKQDTMLFGAKKND